MRPLSCSHMRETGDASPFVPPFGVSTSASRGPEPRERKALRRAATVAAAVILVGAGLSFLLHFRSSTAPSLTAPATSGLQYLGFYTGGSTPALAGAPGSQQVQTRVDIEKRVDEIASAIGQKGDHVHTQLGFWVGPIGWDLTDDQLRTLIDDAFAVAEEKDVAVGFHIEDSMFWNNREDLWSDTDNVEWSDWQGTVVPHRIIGWVGDGKPILAPPMCYNSPAIEAEAKRLAQDVIGAQIKQNADHLASEGKSYLFMGVIAGWETRMQDDSHAPRVLYGYCALRNLGYGASNPPADTDLALQGVVKDWLTLWTKGLNDAGLPKEKIFTHISYTPYTDEVAAQLKLQYPDPVPLRDLYRDSDPDVTAFTGYSNPGFSIYGASSLPGLYALLASHGNPPWGISEGTALTLEDAFSGGAGRLSAMEEYLAGVFNHGGVYVDLFGWNTGSGDAFAKATAGASAIAAYRTFLSGGALSKGSPGAHGKR